ncbi:MAG: glycosyltransferase family 4 protein [Chloroflexi bacterium]|nr:glycosyltransferase family 4 protein [Chloroflexota bacterium]
MRIAMIGLFGLRPKGTMSVRALPLARALVAKGHEVSVIMPPWSYPQDSGREWEEDGVSIRNVTLPPRFPLISYLIITWRLVRQALALRPDVVHCFKPKGYAGLAAMVFWFLKKPGLIKARLVVDSDDWEGKGGWNEIEPYTGLQKRLFAWQERWGLTHGDALTVASRALETIVWSLGVAPGKVFYVPNGVVPSSESNTQYPISNIQYPISNIQFTDHPTVLLYTRFFEFAVERVVEIFRRVLDQVPEAKLLVVGKGFFGEEERLKELMREARIADHLVYVGWVEPDELPAYFAAADVAIYPYDDTLINRTKCAVKLIDLMAAGVPVVADDVGQNGEYVVHGVSGLLVATGDTDAFAGRVIELLRDEGLRARLGEEAQRRILEEFDWGKLAARVEEAYRILDEFYQTFNGARSQGSRVAPPRFAAPPFLAPLFLAPLFLAWWFSKDEDLSKEALLLDFDAPQLDELQHGQEGDDDLQA